MRDIKVASRYAKSLLGIAVELNQLEDVHNDMQMISKVCNENNELVLLLKSPIINSDKKEAILTEIFGKKISQISNTFIAIILNKRRENIIPAIADAFILTYKEHKNITTAIVTTAVALSDAQKKAVIKLLNSQGKENVELKEIVNNEIIGGMILRVGDKQVDESIKRKLANLEMEFDENPYVKEI